MKYLLLIPALLVLLLLIAVVRTLLMPNKRSDYAAPEADDKALLLAQKLSKMIRYDTTSHANVHEEGKFLGAHGSEARVLGGCRHAVANDLLGKAFAHRRNGADAAAQLPVLVQAHEGPGAPAGQLLGCVGWKG